LTLTVASGQGTRFPTVNNGGVAPDEYFHLTLQDASNNFEIVKVTRHDTGSDSFTIVRAIEEATAFPVTSWSIGAMVELRATVGTVQGILADALATSPVLAGTPTAPTAAVDTTTTQIATTAFVIGQAADSAPANLGTAATGASKQYAREDHVHENAFPTQTYGDATTKAATTAFADALRDVPANAITDSYTLALTDRGKSIDFTGAADKTITIPSNAAVPFPVGSVVTISNNSANNLSIAINSDTLRNAGLNSTVASTVTISVATPGVVTWTGHTLSAGNRVKIATTGALPTGLTAGTTYYVVAPVVAGTSFALSATAGGAAINTTGTQSGVHTATVERTLANYGVATMRKVAATTWVISGAGLT
jgi:hypothetical protein